MAEQILILFVGSLSVWRISHAVVKESGPLMIFARLRAFLAAKQKRSGGLFDAVSCVACISVWVGLLAALWVAQDEVTLLGYGLAFSAIAMLLETFVTKNSNALPLVTSPTTNNKVPVSGSPTPK